MLKSLFGTFGPLQSNNILMHYWKYRRALQLWCTKSLHQMVAYSWKIQFNDFSHTFSKHFNKFFIVKGFIFNFCSSLTQWILKWSSPKKLPDFISKTLMYIKFTFYGCIFFEEFNLTIIFIHFPYIPIHLL